MPINQKVVGRMIFANVLEMKIDKYLNYVDKFVNVTSADPFYGISHIDERILTKRPKGVTGIVVKEDNEFRFCAPEYIKLDFELLWEPGNTKWKHCMNWINTKNSFLHHVITNLFVLQRDFWQTQDRKTMAPVLQKEFLEKFPFPYLDASRLSRLLSNTYVSFNGTKYLLRDLFWNRRKVHTCILEHVIRQQAYRVKDHELQEILKRDHGIDLSVRSICNYRQSVGIPAYNKDYLCIPYDNCFSKLLTLHNKSLPMIPKKAGVYEISIDKDIRYQNIYSRVIYFGRSNNLRNRIQSYLYNNIKNSVLERHRKSHELFIRYFVTHQHIQVEEELLRRFRDTCGSLPVANKLPKR